MPRISIIVPVYNAEKYLRKCVDSILSQTFTGFECILVDDGSTDNSPQICDEYAATDRRIIVIHTANAGVSAARNTGLARARGEWIGFVDNDDWCDCGMFQFLYENAIKHDADVSICENMLVFEDTGEIREPKNAGKEILFNDDPNGALFSMFTYQTPCFPVWNKLIKTEYLNRYNLRFDQNIRYVEDMLFSYQLLKQVKRIIYSPKIYYNFLQHKDSQTHGSGLMKDVILAAYNKILSVETNKELCRLINLHKIDCASDICYLEAENHRDCRYTIFSRAAKKHLFSILALPLPVKARLTRFFCVVSPAAFVSLRRKYRTIKRRPVS